MIFGWYSYAQSGGIIISGEGEGTTRYGSNISGVKEVSSEQEGWGFVSRGR